MSEPLQLTWRDRLWFLWAFVRRKLKWRYWRCRWRGHRWENRDEGWRECRPCGMVSIPADAPEGAMAAALGVRPEAGGEEADDE